MVLLIDAYNLLHHSDLMGRGRGPGWLQKARLRLVKKLESHLDEPLLRQTCLVFDAPSKLSDSEEEISSVLDVRYAVGHAEADDLIEELIARHSAPKRLSVVSSDHRIQRAAKRRGAAHYDADLWYDHLVERGPMLGIPWPPSSLSAGRSPHDDGRGFHAEDDPDAEDDFGAELGNPFPEGYGEDLLG